MLRSTRLLTVVAALLLVGCTALFQDCTNCPNSHPPSSVTIAAVGDTNGYNIFGDSQIQEDPLKETKDLLTKQDVFILNFEGVLLPKEPEPGTCPESLGQSTFYSLPQIADFLHPTQRTIATLANNHVLDCGVQGVQKTVHELTSRKILTVGAGNNSEQACTPVQLQVNGIRLAVVAYLAMEPDSFSARSDQAGAASWEECEGEKQVAALVAEGYVVVVALHLHLGPGWTDHTLPDHLALVQSVLAAGAEMVIAHGPHVPQGIFQSHGRVALLSLGNFLLHPDYKMSEKAHRSVVAQISISADRIELALVPLRLDDVGRPRVPTSQDASQILKDIAALSAKFGTTVEVREGIGYVTVQRQR